MRRFNFDQTAYQRLLAGTPVRAMVIQLRLPIAAIGAALLAVAGGWSIETQRIAALDAELSGLHARAQATAAGAARADRLTAAVARLRAIQDGIAAARRDVLETTNTIAQIGNQLPPQTWLTGVGSTAAGDWTIGGRSTRVDEIGTMLRRVQGIDPSATARLVSIAATGRSGRILDFVIGWERRT
jgi:Tfp pilus assembly protein PilN